MDLFAMQVVVVFLELPEVATLQCVNRHRRRLYSNKGLLWRKCLWHNGCASRCRLAYWQHALHISEIQRDAIEMELSEEVPADSPASPNAPPPTQLTSHELKLRALQYYRKRCVWDEKGTMQMGGVQITIENALKGAVGVEREILLDVGRTYPNRSTYTIGKRGRKLR